MSETTVKLLGHVTICGEIEAVTGLSIGGTADAIDKGGIDRPVIKNPVTNEPYIPGSSLRGRMRSLLEKKGGRKLTEMAKGKGIWMEIYEDGEEKRANESEVCRVFGNSNTGLPSILLVRDALYTSETRKQFVRSNLPITEAKIEIAVDRITAQALPRTFERVPSGARFEFSIVYRVQQDEKRPDAPKNVKQDLENILWALEEIETHDGLGGNTARGHGQVKFHMRPLTVKRYDKSEAISKNGLEDDTNNKNKDYSFDTLNEAVGKINFGISETP
jgi:CRISPR-associated protein Csm3